MFKTTRKLVLIATLTLAIAAALPGLALAAHGNNSRNNSSNSGGGPPACRNLEGSLDTLRQMVVSLTTTVNTVNTNVTNLNTRIDSINTNLDDLASAVADIQATIEAQGISSLQAEVAVDEAACASGFTQCASPVAANSTNQNPVALHVLVMRGTTPVTNLTSANFTVTTDFGPGLAPANLVLCSSGDTGCGSGSFVVNSGSGGYLLWLSPTSNWLPGTYTVQLQVTDGQGHTAIELVKITIPA